MGCRKKIVIQNFALFTYKRNILYVFYSHSNYPFHRGYRNPMSTFVQNAPPPPLMSSALVQAVGKLRQWDEWGRTGEPAQDVAAAAAGRCMRVKVIGHRHHLSWRSWPSSNTLRWTLLSKSKMEANNYNWQKKKK